MSRVSKHKIIFLHIEKAGGSTLHNILANMYQPAEVLHLEYMQTGERELAGLNTHSLQLIKGHNVFGTHRFADPEWKYYSMLREPISRAVSYYYYVKQKNTHHHSALISEKNWSLDQYIVEAGNLQMDNGQVRYISGSQKPFGSIDKTDLQLAIENINRYFISVGLTERFDESLVILKNKLAWEQQPVYERANVNRNKQIQLTETDNKKLAEFNRFDSELYEYVKTQFNIEASQDFVQSGLVQLKRAINRYYFKKRISVWFSKK